MASDFEKSTKNISEKPRKTRSITFRLDSSVVEELEEESEKCEVSLNVLVNQVLKRYTEWDRYETKLGMMPVPRIMLSLLIDNAISVGKSNGIKDVDRYRNEIIKRASQTAFEMMKDSVLFMKKHYNLWVVLSVLQEYMKVSGIKSDHHIEGSRKHVFMIQHDLGENWSLFIKQLLILIFENLANVRAEISVTPNTTIAEVNLA